MTPNHVYQAIIQALESVLSPRVVSLVLREGLAEVGRTPNDLRLDDVEPILTGPAFRRLQAIMSPDEARSRVQGFLESIPSAVAADGATGPGGPSATAGPIGGSDAAADASADRLESLRAALRPFNLYFDWHEVRKLRALLQVAEEELAAALDPSASLDEAASQLELVRQKLEDRLVLQARELAELEEALAVVSTLGGPRVRRLEALIGQIRHAQASRELAEAETERAAVIARDLRKLMESSVAVSVGGVTDADAERADAGDGLGDDDLPVVTIDEAQLPAEVGERLRRVDLEGEAKALAALGDAHAELLRYLPALAHSLQRARERIESGTPLGSDVDALRQELAEATRRQRQHLAEELTGIEARLATLSADDDTAALERALRVAQGVLEDGLPAFADVVALRELHDGAQARAAERTRRDEERREREAQRRASQQALLMRLAQALARAQDAADASLDEPRRHLGAAYAALERAEHEGRGDDDAIAAAQHAEQAWEHALAAHARDGHERHVARVRELRSRLDAIPGDIALSGRRDALARDLSDAEREPSLDERHVALLASLVEQLHRDALDGAAATLERLAQEAAEAAGSEVLRAFQEATQAIQAGTFPDVAALAQLVGEARRHHREREQRRLQHLQSAMQRYEAAAVPSLVALTTHLEAVRATLQRGRNSAAEFAQAEAALERVEREVAERLERFGPRLDAALATLARVERLNNEDVAMVRRVLSHLDSQREALPRVSAGLQHQLDRALGEAEQRLPALEEAYEATRAVAGRLVEANMLDDMLGFFDDFGTDHDAEAHRTWGDAGALHALLARFRALDDVTAVAVVSADGKLRSGDLGDTPLDPLVPALGLAAASWDALGDHLGSGPVDLVDVSLGGRRALLTPLGADAHAIVVVRSSGAVSALTTRLREQRPALQEAVAAAT